MTGRRAALLICNVAAGRARHDRLAAVTRHLERLGVDTTIRQTARPGHATELARDACGFDLVIVAGGDGTVNEVVAGLPPGAPPLAVLPLGTANVLAAELGLDRDAHRFATAVAAGHVVAAWPGEINHRYFLAMASVGFDAEVVATVTPHRKRWLGKAAYILAAITLWLAGRPTDLQVTADGIPYRCAGVVVGKGRYYAGRYTLMPGASIATPALFVVLLPGAGRRDLLRYARAMLHGRLHVEPGVTTLRAQRVTIASTSPAVIQLDGDIRTTTPAEIRVGASPLRLITALHP